MNKKTMLFGGSFDPPHLGHLVMAQLAAEALDCAVRFLPAAVPPHKEGTAAARHRLAMVEAAIAGNPRFQLDTSEIALPGPSYTCQTLAAMAERGEAKPHFLLGSDSLLAMDSWHNPRGVLSLCLPVVYRRGPVEEEALARLRREFGLGEVKWVDGPLLDISSTLIRSRVAREQTVHYLVPPAVEDYIAAAGLYQGGK